MKEIDRYNTGFTFRHVKFVVDEDVNRGFWKDYRSYMESVKDIKPSASSRIEKNPGLFLRRRKRDRQDSTLLSAIGKIAYGGSPIGVKESSYLLLLVTWMYAPEQRYSLKDRLYALDILLSSCSTFDSEEVWNVRAMLMGEYIHTGTPIPLDMLLEMAGKYDSFKIILEDEIYLQYLDDRDDEKFISYLQLLYPEMKELRNAEILRYFLGHLPENFDFMEYNDAVSPQPCYSVGSRRGRRSQEQKMEDELDKELVECQNGIYGKIWASIKPNAHSFVYDVGLAFEGCAIVPDKCLKRRLCFLLNHIRVVLDYLDDIHAMGAYPQPVDGRSGVLEAVVSMYLDWIGKPSYPNPRHERKLPLRMEDWFIPTEQYRKVEGNDSHLSFITFMPFNYESFSYRLVAGEGHDRTPLDLDVFSKANIRKTVESLRDVYGMMKLGIESEEEAAKMMELLQMRYNEIWKVSRDDAMEVWDIIRKVSSLWRIPIDINDMTRNPDISYLVMDSGSTSEGNWSNELILSKALAILGDDECYELFERLCLEDVFCRTCLKLHEDDEEIGIDETVDIVGSVFFSLVYNEQYDDDSDIDAVSEYVQGLLKERMSCISKERILEGWMAQDFSDSFVIPKEYITSYEHFDWFSYALFYRNIVYIRKLEITGDRIRKRNLMLDDCEPFEEQRDEAVQAYARWRLSFLAGKPTELLDDSWTHIMFSELSHVAEDERTRAVSAMMRLLDYPESSELAEDVLLYLIQNGLPVPMKLLEGNVDSEFRSLKTFRLVELIDGKGLSFEVLDFIAGGRLCYDGCLSDAMKFIFPKLCIALGQGKVSSNGCKEVDFETVTSTSSLGDLICTLRIPSYGGSEEEISSIWKATHAIIYDIVHDLGPHAIVGFTERECFTMRRMIWEELFMNKENRKRFFPDYMMPENPIWPYDLSSGERNKAGINSVLASYFISPDRLRFPDHHPELRDFVNAAENGAFYSGLLTGGDWDTGIAAAVASAGDDLIYPGELCYRYFGRQYHTSMTEKEPELFRYALSIAFKAYMEFRQKQRMSILDMHYMQIKLQDGYDGYGLRFNYVGDDAVLRLADNAVRKLKGKTLLKAQKMMPMHKHVEKALNEWVDAGGYSPYRKEDVKISREMLDDLRRRSDAVREALKTEEDDDIPDSDAGLSQIADDDVEEISFSRIEKEVLEALLYEEDAEMVAEEEFLTLDVVLDSINTKAFDIFGESIVSEDGEIYEEYEEEIRKLLSI